MLFGCLNMRRGVILKKRSCKCEERIGCYDSTNNPAFIEIILPVKGTGVKSKNLTLLSLNLWAWKAVIRTGNGWRSS